MCGIFGYVTTGPGGARNDALSEALDSLKHRGPDDSGTFESSARGVRCGLAHRRLAILDLSTAGRQPMATDDGRFVIAYNGEVYNHAAIRRDLEALGERFQSTSDTEVVLKAYARWGKDSLRRLRGMFAFAIFDAERGSLVLARDRLGIKPLYYIARGGDLTFASEVRTLLATGAAPRRINPAAVCSFLAFGSVAEPDSIIDGVQALPPGALLEYDSEGYSISTYWSINAAPEAASQEMTFSEAIERICPILQDAVRLMLIADVPVGVFLSGGIDSSAIVALAAEASTSPVHTFTVTFDEEAFSEAPYAAEVARTFGCDHHQVHLPASQVVREINEAVASLDQPSADGINTYFVSKAARGAGLRVALSGLGADELFAGYGYFRSFGRMLASARALRPAAPVVSRLLGSLGAWGGIPLRARKLLGALATRGDPAAMYAVIRGMFAEDQRRALLAPGFADALTNALDAERDRAAALLPPAAHDAPDAVSLFSALELTSYLRNTLLRDTDVMSMAHSLEVRVPFLDHLLVEAVLPIPGRLKLNSAANKPLLQAAVPGLSASTKSRPKMGFTFPFDAWFRGPLRPFMRDALLGEPVRRLGFLRPAAVEALWASFLEGSLRVSHARVWSIAALAMWCAENRVST